MSQRPTGQLVAVFGTSDRELPEMLTALGVRMVSLPVGQLSSLPPNGRKHDVALLDVRATKKLPEDIAIFRRRHPDTALVLITTGLEPALILDAMRAGITECITDTLTAPVLEAALHRVAAQKTPAATGDLFAFLGAKGGVGTTTIAVNVATALAATRQPTLFIDLHAAYGDAAVFLGAEPRFSILDALENIHRLDTALFKTLIASTECGVDVLASSSSSGQVAAIDTQQLRRLIEFASQHYRFIVVDCPRSGGTILDALESASKIILVTNQELATLRNGSRMATMLRLRYPGDRIKVVVTRFDSAAEIGSADVARVIGSPVNHIVPSDYRTSIQALNRGKPLILKNHTRLAGSLNALARDLGGQPPVDVAQAKTPGLFGRLTGKR
jgi:pilus assembly protein CpaE